MPIKDTGAPQQTPWEVGDLALCVKGGFIDAPGVKLLTPPCGYPVAGRIGKVLEVSIQRLGGAEKLVLTVDGKPPNAGSPSWAAYRFVKIPPHSIDDEDRETIDLLKRRKAKI